MPLQMQTWRLADQARQGLGGVAKQSLPIGNNTGRRVVDEIVGRVILLFDAYSCLDCGNALTGCGQSVQTTKAEMEKEFVFDAKPAG